MEATEWIRAEEAASRAGISRTTFLTLVSQGKAPQPDRPGSRCSRYKEAEIEIWRRSYAIERQQKKRRSHMARAPR
jgi:predicted DNA-binding transcriptional regulator AlpA